MQQPRRSTGGPALRELVLEASRSLARLDAKRLDELAISCRALSRKLDTSRFGEGHWLASEAGYATRELVALAHILDATRANMRVMRQLTKFQKELPEYGPIAGKGGPATETKHGDN